MPELLSDRQRIELAIPPYLLFRLSNLPNVFMPGDANLADRARSDVANLCTQLRTVSLEPFSDLAPKKRDALLRRLERVVKKELLQWKDDSALYVMMKLCIFLEILTKQKLIILWEGTPMDWAMRQLTFMSKHGFDEPELVAVAHAQAAQLLDCFQKEGVYLLQDRS